MLRWALAAASLLLVSNACAADADGNDSWTLQATGYLWASGIDGRISPFQIAPTIHIQKSFSDIISNLNLGGFAYVYGRYDRFVVVSDTMYVNTTDAKSIGALPIIGPTPGLGASVDTKEFTETLLAGYEAVNTPDFTFDFLGGIRVWSISNDVRVRFASLSRSYGESFSWVDPVVGVRARFHLTDDISVLVQPDWGGFQAGSNYTWQAIGTVNYALTDSMSLSAGYKALRTNYRSDGYVFDTILKGPVLGMTYRF
jgi:hypothetical protein